MFFEECQCEAPVPHAGHRTYRWVRGEIIANPDFDEMLTRSSGPPTPEARRRHLFTGQ